MKHFQRIYVLLILFFYPLCQYGQERINWIDFTQLDSLLAISARETLLFIHTDWCSYCRKIEQEIFTKKEIVQLINKRYYAVKLDAESIDEIAFDRSIWKPLSKRKKTGQFHPLALQLLQGRKMIFPTLLRFDSEFRLKNIQQKYLNSKELAVFLE
ncbi:MAG: hypothetical protein K0S31_3087 [Sphingobacterium multivorum]|jgi:thioredoxin-related protein|nr:hypothetical protein [Sphingobacterium multivorum]